MYSVERNSAAAFEHTHIWGSYGLSVRAKCTALCDGGTRDLSRGDKDRPAAQEQQYCLAKPHRHTYAPAPRAARTLAQYPTE